MELERPWLNVEANEGLILQATKKPLTIEALRQAADGLGVYPNGKLAMAPAFADVWQRFAAAILNS
jgi:hypothetical protein